MVTATKIILALLQAHASPREGSSPPGLPRLRVRRFAADCWTAIGWKPVAAPAAS